MPDYSSAQGLADFQQWYGQQQGGKRPEDMERFLQTDTLKRWDPYLITSGPYAGKYRSMRGAEGYYDKPQECPDGQVPSGPNETDPCRPMAAWEGGGAPAAAPATGTAWGQQLGGVMSGVQASPVPQADAGVRMPETGGMSGRELAAMLTPYMSQSQPMQSATGNLMQSTMAATKPGATMQPAAGTGWSSGQDGLARMMAQRQRSGQGWWV